MAESKRRTYLQKFLTYIDNVGGECKVEWFDTDWEPIGTPIRKELKDLGLIEECNGFVYRTAEN